MFLYQSHPMIYPRHHGYYHSPSDQFFHHRSTPNFFMATLLGLLKISIIYHLALFAVSFVLPNLVAIGVLAFMIVGLKKLFQGCSSEACGQGFCSESKRRSCSFKHSRRCTNRRQLASMHSPLSFQGPSLTSCGPRSNLKKSDPVAQQRDQVSENGSTSRMQTFTVWPSIHSEETKDEMTLFLDVPGFILSNLQVVVERGDVLVISGERTNKLNKRFVFSRRFGFDSTRWSLETVRADLSEGVLEIHVARNERSKDRTIVISTSNAKTIKEDANNDVLDNENESETIQVETVEVSKQGDKEDALNEDDINMVVEELQNDVTGIDKVSEMVEDKDHEDADSWEPVNEKK